MNKPYLLIVNDQYYPNHGTGDWKGCYEYTSDAMAEGERLCDTDECKKYTVVDLRTWING